MNDATDPVGGEPWLATDADEGGPTSLSSETREVEFGGRRWELPPDPGPGAADGLTRAAAPPPELAAFETIDWQAWAASDPGAAAQAWSAYEVLAADHADEVERAGRLVRLEAELARDIEGWSPQLAADLAAYGQSKGFTPEELAGVEDAREIKVLHLAMIGEEALAAAEQARTQAQRFGRFRPPTQVGGAGHPGNIPHERQSTEAWMQARQSQLRKKARR